jgi:hypothetical protein
MAYARLFVGVIASLVLPSPTNAGNGSYEPPHPPHIIRTTQGARSFYAEFRARDDANGIGHSYIALGTVDFNGEIRQTVVAGFMPRGATDDSWSHFGIPVTGVVGVVRSDFTRRADARFRIAITEANYYQIVSKIRQMRRTWTTYELLFSNCNSFVGEIASMAGLRIPLVPARFPVTYVSELRTLNSP